MMKNLECLRKHLALVRALSNNPVSISAKPDFRCPGSCLLANSWNQMTTPVPLIKMPRLVSSESIEIAGNYDLSKAHHFFHTDRGPPSL
jgi:hypothetical protein